MLPQNLMVYGLRVVLVSGRLLYFSARCNSLQLHRDWLCSIYDLELTLRGLGLLHLTLSFDHHGSDDPEEDMSTDIEGAH